MLMIGRFNRLQVLRSVDFGLYLDGGEDGDILLPAREIKGDPQPGDFLHVFIYHDSEDRLIATSRRPRVQLGECASLIIKDTGRFGAFLDWGLGKDLLLPHSQQRGELKPGDRCFVYVYLDQHTERLAASMKLNNFLSSDHMDRFELNEEVQLVVCERTRLGYKAVINQSHLGMILNQDLLQPLKIGQKLTGFIRELRSDGKISLALQLQGQEVRDYLSDQILAALDAAGGSLELTDKSAPEEIFRAFQVSKGNYKKAIGGLYKRRLIRIEDDRIVRIT